MTARRPSGLGAEGARLWREITGELVLDVGDGALLGAACRTADEVALMEAALGEMGLWTEGANQQKRLTPLLAQLSVHRGRLARLLQQLLPAHEEESASAGASAMAQRRWSRSRGA